MRFRITFDESLAWYEDKEKNDPGTVKRFTIIASEDNFQTQTWQTSIPYIEDPHAIADGFNWTLNALFNYIDKEKKIQAELSEMK